MAMNFSLPYSGRRDFLIGDKICIPAEMTLLYAVCLLQPDMQLSWWDQKMVQTTVWNSGVNTISQDSAHFEYGVLSWLV